MDSNVLSLAIVRFLGYGTEVYPNEDQARLVDEFGVDLASGLEPEVGKLLDELNKFEPDWSKHSLTTAGIWIKEETRRKYPELNEDALNAIEWAFTWWWR